MTNLFRVSGDDLVPVSRTTLTSEDELEGWIAKDLRRIGLDVLVLGRQITTAYGGRIDILGIERDGSLTIIELKRDRTPREIVAQVLDYASWVRKLTSREVNEIALLFHKEPLATVFEKFFGDPLPDNLNMAHNMVIVASEFDDSSRRIVEYLSDEYGVSINTAFFNVFQHNGEMFLATDWLIDQEQVIEKAKAKKEYPWTGWYYVNAGDGPSRSWEDMRKYGFISAGGGRQYSDKLKKLEPENEVFVYQKGRGYVGYGKVTAAVVPASQFQVDAKLLFTFPLEQPNLNHDANDPDMAEYAVGIKWERVVPLAEAKTFPGAFANQNIVCKLTDPATIEFLKKEFLAAPASS